MTPAPARPALHLGARIVLGGAFAYLGATKALDPVGFLKLVREFDFVPFSFLLNFIAAVLPWLEILCGVLLVLGARRRAAALVAGVLLAGFTAAVAWRAWAVYRGEGVSFCAIRFDCGCGTGEILICSKLAQNLALGVLGWITFSTAPDRNTAAISA